MRDSDLDRPDRHMRVTTAVSDRVLVHPNHRAQRNNNQNVNRRAATRHIIMLSISFRFDQISNNDINYKPRELISKMLND